MAKSKEERAEYMKQWREKNKDRVKAYRRAYYFRSLANGKYVPPPNEKSREVNRRWREKNRERFNEYHRKYQARKRREKREVVVDKTSEI